VQVFATLFIYYVIVHRNNTNIKYKINGIETINLGTCGLF